MLEPQSSIDSVKAKEVWQKIQEPFLIAMTNAWPPKAFGHGVFFKQLLEYYNNAIILGPKNNPTGDRRYYAVYDSDESDKRTILYRLKRFSQYLWIPIKYLFKSHRRPNLTIASQIIPTGIACLIIKSIFRIPYIVVVHGEELAIFNQNRYKAQFWIAKFVLEHSQVAICNSSSTRGIVEKYYSKNRQKLVVIHPGVLASERFVDRALVDTRKKKLRPNWTTVMMAGRLSETRKGFSQGIKAFAEATKSHPKTQLLIVGPGDLTQLKDLTAQLGLSDKVQFTGMLSRSEILACFAACDIFMLPNQVLKNGDHEGFGIVFLEANLFGKPAIGGNSGGVPDAIADGVSGLLVDSNSTSSIAAALNKLIGDKDLRERIGFKAFDRVISEFTSEQTAKKFKNLIISITTKHENRCKCRCAIF